MSHNHHAVDVHRRRRDGKKEPFDFVVYFFAVATPLFELPQAAAIYGNKSAENVSILTWMFFLVADVVWLTYAIRKRITILVVMYTIYLAVEGAIVAGIIAYS